MKRPRLPAQLTEARVAKICELVAKGVPQQAAAGSLGIPKRTFQEWLEKGRRPDAVEPYRSLAERLAVALDKFHATRVVQLHKVGNDDPKVLQWELERRFASDWADQTRGVGVQVNLGVIVQSPDWLALREQLLSALAPFPDALDAVVGVLGGGDVVEGEAIEIGDLAA